MQTSASGGRTEVTCPSCGGSGKTQPPAGGKGWNQFGTMCPRCNGWGKVYR